MSMKILSWNVNGVRAAAKAGFVDTLRKLKPDVLCLQESRALPDDLDESLLAPKGYVSHWNPAQKKGYSGTAVFVKSSIEPRAVRASGLKRFDEEGRLQIIELDGLNILNGYWPNSQPERKRLDYKIDFCKSIKRIANKMVKDGQNVVLCGDFNIAHQPIDLARPKANENNAGYYIEEREALSKILKKNYVDTFRHMYPDKVEYSWWSMRGGARAKNVGWRLDYHCVNKEFIPRIRKAWISGDVMGSDHCPVGIEVE